MSHKILSLHAPDFSTLGHLTQASIRSEKTYNVTQEELGQIHRRFTQMEALLAPSILDPAQRSHVLLDCCTCEVKSAFFLCGEESFDRAYAMLKFAKASLRSIHYELLVPKDQRHYYQESLRILLLHHFIQRGLEITETVIFTASDVFIYDDSVEAFIGIIQGLHQTNAKAPALDYYEALLVLNVYSAHLTRHEQCIMLAHAWGDLPKEAGHRVAIKERYDRLINSALPFPLPTDIPHLDLNNKWTSTLFANLQEHWIFHRLRPESRQLLEASRRFESDRRLSDEGFHLDPILFTSLSTRVSTPVCLNVSEQLLATFIGHLHPIEILDTGGIGHYTFMVDLVLIRLGLLTPSGKKTALWDKPRSTDFQADFRASLAELAPKYGLGVDLEALEKLDIGHLLDSHAETTRQLRDFRSQYFESLGPITALGLLSKSLGKATHGLPPENPDAMAMSKVAAQAKKTAELAFDIHQIMTSALSHDEKIGAIRQWASTLSAALQETDEGRVVQITLPQGPHKFDPQHTIYGLLEKVADRIVRMTVFTSDTQTPHQKRTAAAHVDFRVERHVIREGVYKVPQLPREFVHPKVFEFSPNEIGHYPELEAMLVFSQSAQLSMAAEGCSPEQYTSKLMCGDFLSGLTSGDLSATRMTQKDSAYQVPVQVMRNCTVFNFLETLTFAFSLSPDQYLFLTQMIEFGIGRLHGDFFVTLDTLAPGIEFPDATILHEGLSEGNNGLTYDVVRGTGYFSDYFLEKHYARDKVNAAAIAQNWTGTVTVIKISGQAALDELLEAAKKKAKTLTISTAWHHVNGKYIKTITNAKIGIGYDGEKIHHLDFAF